MADENPEDNADKLHGREIPSAVNTPELIEAHLKVTQGKVRTRFPPEPNGYLHIGHAKSMNMNFSLAFEKLGVPPEKRQTIFRYDDTNPEAESSEYIQSLAEDVDWMGWKPDPVTFTSDYFQRLYELAVELIVRGKAYVCHLSKAEIEACREIAKAKAADPNAPGDPCSPYRNRPVAESLKEFENMKNGKYGASDATLRMKMDMTSPNPNMWDQVAYRIKYVPHPHAGSEWCIYPTYDYTHCIIDSLENVDYSICTLEFETRRESYFWVLEALDMYRPKVYEMSRLNISYTILSKRKLLKLVEGRFMRGWDDPRMPTIKGLRRRGYTAAILNTFCREIGATRSANTVQYERLAACARNLLHETSPRVMAVLNPLKVIITNRPSSATPSGAPAASGTGASGGFLCTVPDFPFDPSRGSHTVLLDSDEVYIDQQDFRVEGSDDYYGLAPGKVVGLKYAFRIHCDSYECDASGAPCLLRCTALADNQATPGSAAGGDDKEGSSKPKVAIQWVPAATSVVAEVRMYGSLFNVEEPSDTAWESELNPESEVVLKQARIDPSIRNWKPQAEMHFQFERLGFFVVDKDTKRVGDEDQLVFNLTVTLKDSKPKPVSGTGGGTGAGKSRKDEQARQLAEKMARMNISPIDMFKSQTDLYSQFDEEGMPTVDAAGEKITKSMYKKLRKDWEKQKKLFESSSSSSVP